MTLHDLTEFAFRAGGRCFARWTLGEARRWLEHHLQQGHVIYATDGRGQIIALGIGWQLPKAEVPETPKGMDLWREGHRTGDAFYLAQLICTDPAGFAALVAGWQAAFPEWERLTILAHRLRRGDGPGKVARRVSVPFTTFRRMGQFARCWRDGHELTALAA